MAGKRGRRWVTPEQARTTEEGRIGLLAPRERAERLAWLIKWRDLYLACAASSRALAESYGESRALAQGRAARWRDTYYQRFYARQAEREAAQADAYAEALAAAEAERLDWAGEHRATQGRHYGLTGPGTSAAERCPLCPSYDAPAGAGDEVEAYRG